MFVSGKKHGAGKIEFPDGAVYTGNWLEDKEIGAGIYSSKTGESVFGHWDVNKGSFIQMKDTSVNGQ